MKPAFQAVRYFLPEQDIDRLETLGSGNVNDTFLVILADGRQLVLQRVNPSVFPDPQLVQHNMRIVTEHLRRQVNKIPEGKDSFIPLMLVRGKNGDSYQDNEGAVWRLMNYIPGTNRETIGSPSQALELGRCLGIFHRLLSTLNAAHLADTLPGFHHTPSCLRHYDRIRAAASSKHRGKEVNFCDQFIADRRNLSTLLLATSGLGRGVIHGDPKVANFVFADSSDRIISLIDLDTIRPGLLLHDIGDALRSSCNPEGETPAAPERIRFDADLFAAWLEGYCAEAGTLLTDADKQHIVDAVLVIAFELGLRFFTDHLAGDRYFKVRSPGQNLARALVQFHLVLSIETQQVRLQNIVQKLVTI